jgi:hypothetical protein
MHEINLQLEFIVIIRRLNVEPPLAHWTKIFHGYRFFLQSCGGRSSALSTIPV